MWNEVRCSHGSEHCDQDLLGSGADPGAVGPEAYIIFGALFKKSNTKLGTKVNIY
jgi:hypothetical protein